MSAGMIWRLILSGFYRLALCKAHHQESEKYALRIIETSVYAGKNPLYRIYDKKNELKDAQT